MPIDNSLLFEELARGILTSTLAGTMQVFVNGVISGATIALLALAFAVVYLPTRVFHIALAGIYSLAPFLALSLGNVELPWVVCTGTAIAAGIALSAACEWFNHARLEEKGSGPGLHLVSSLGIFIVIVQIIAMIWGNEVRVLRQGVDTVFSTGTISVTRAQAIAGAGSCGLLLGFYLWLRFSNLGLQFRALAGNPIQLAFLGYNTRRLRLLAFGIAGLLATASSLFVSFDIGFDPHGGLHALLLAIVAVIIGGQESLLGPVLAGFILGVIRAEVVWYASAPWQDAVTYALLVLLLFLRPEGLIGSKMRLEAQT